MDRLCGLTECSRPRYARNLCKPHYDRLRKYGDPSAGGIERGSVLRWLTATVAELEQAPTDLCVPHPFHPGNGGYGSVRINGRQMYLCRAVLLLAGRAAPPGGHTRHLCGNPPCVNPAHIRFGTAQENANDRELHGRTAHGAQIPQFKLSDATIREIRSSPERNRDLAIRLGVDPSTISHIRRGSRRQRVQ